METKVIHAKPVVDLILIIYTLLLCLPFDLCQNLTLRLYTIHFAQKFKTVE